MSARLAVLAAALGLAGCATRFAGETRPRLEGCAIARAWDATPGRFGVVADSQFNTLHTSYRSLYRKRPADRLLDVAIRPPALDYTSHHLLRAILTKQVEGGAEVIFYLGDGANNGCADELVGHRDVDGIDGVFNVLRQARARFGVPIFFVVGNHDYLGAGNTSAWLSTRHALCNSTRRGANASLTKLEVLRLVHDFNAESAALAERWDYHDNFDERRLARACNGGAGDHPRNQHLRRGCWLAGHLRDREAGVEYLLVDSNDYADVPASLFFAGRRGGVSYRRAGALSQIDWLARAADPAPALRVVLSHYDVATINADDDAGRRHDRLGRLIADDHTVWISAHTHHPELRRLPHRFRRARARAPVAVVETNVGSTTDYPAYGLLAEAVLDPATRRAALARATQVFATTPERCAPILAELDQVVAGSRYFPFRRHTRGLGLFGLDFLVDFTFAKKEYRHRTWTRADDQHVRDNIQTWLDLHAPPRPEDQQCGWPGPERLQAGACVAFYASLQEGVKQGWAPVTCDECRPEPRRPAPRSVAPEGGIRLR